MVLLQQNPQGGVPAHLGCPAGVSIRLAKLSHAKARDLPLNELLKGPQHLSNTELALDDPHGTCGVAFCPTEGIGWGFSCTMAAALRNHQTVQGDAVMGW